MKMGNSKKKKFNERGEKKVGILRSGRKGTMTKGGQAGISAQNSPKPNALECRVKLGQFQSQVSGNIKKVLYRVYASGTMDFFRWNMLRVRDLLRGFFSLLSFLLSLTVRPRP
jgi:hypothetical protein